MVGHQLSKAAALGVEMVSGAVSLAFRLAKAPIDLVTGVGVGVTANLTGGEPPPDVS